MAWEGEEPEQKINVLTYVLKMRDHMQRLTELVQEYAVSSSQAAEVV